MRTDDIAALVLTATLALPGAYLLACAPRAVTAPKQIDVRIVEMPERGSCYLSEMPDAPELLELNFDDEDIIRRTTVNIREFNEMVQWQRDVVMWTSEVRSCLAQITGQEL